MNAFLATIHLPLVIAMLGAFALFLGALATRELFASNTGPALTKRVWPESVSVKTFASGSGTLAWLCPVAYNSSTNLWVPWAKGDSPIQTITPSGTVSGGVWTITVNGETTGNIDYNANAAAIKTALVALGNVDSADVTVTGGGLDATNPVAPVVLTWGGQYANKAMTVTITVSSLTGGGSATLANTVSGGKGTNIIRGFLYEGDGLALSSTGEVQGNVMTRGKIDYNDIALPAGQVSADLQAALREGPRELGLEIVGLSQVR